MPNHSATMDMVFHALGNSTRREVVALLARGSASMSQLAEPFNMALPSFLQHLGVLEKAGVIRSEKAGRVRTYELVPQTIVSAEHWLETQHQQWSSRLDRLDSLLINLKDN